MADKSRFGRTLENVPWAEEIEKSVLSCLFQEEFTVEIFQSGLSEEHFYDGRHKLIFAAIKNCWETKNSCQFPLVYTELEKNKETKAKYGGIEYLTEVVDYVASPLNWKAFVTEAEKYRKARKALWMSWEVKQSIGENVDVEKAVDHVAELMDDFQQVVTGEIESSVLPAFDEFLDDLDNYRRGVAVNMGIPSGWDYFDKITTGFHGGENVVIAARPSMGKTVVGLNLAENIAVCQKIPVLFISMEMRTKRLMERMACSMSRVNIHNFRTGFATNDDFMKLAEMRPWLENAPLHMIYRPGLKTFEFQNLVKYFIRKHGIKVLILDYLGLMKPSKPGRSAEEDISKVSDTITQVIRSNSICGITLAQMNRDSEKEKKRLPRLSDLRGSGSIEQDADSVIFIHTPFEENTSSEDSSSNSVGDANSNVKWNDVKKKVQLVVVKNRNGPDGVANFIFHKSCLRFEAALGVEDLRDVKVSFSKYLDDKWGIGGGEDVDISDIPPF